YPRDIGGSTDKYWMLFYRVFKVVLLRELRRANRSFNTFVIDNAVMFIIGALIALLFGEMMIGSSSFTSQVTGMELTFGILTMQQSLRLFGNDTVRSVFLVVVVVVAEVGWLICCVHDIDATGGAP